MPWADSRFAPTYQRWTWYPRVEDVDQAIALAYTLPVHGVEYDDGRPAESSFTDIPLEPGCPFVRIYLSAEDSEALCRELSAELNRRGWAFTLDEVRSEDWADAWKRYYTPQYFHQGFVVVPSWVTPSPVDADHTVWLDPGMAFGTGTHATTRLCANALLDMDLSQKRVLDLGAGSGILGLIAAKHGARRVVMVEPDPVAVKALGQNLARNQLGEQVTVIAGTLQDLLPEPFEVLCLNLIWDIIQSEWHPLQQYIAQEATILLSGLLPERQPDVRALVRETGHHLARIEEAEGWMMAVAAR